MTDPKKPHVHADLIKAWADGAEIESYCNSSHQWQLQSVPMWHERKAYRIKPQPHKWQKEIDAQKAGKTIQYRYSRNRASGGFSSWITARGHGWKFNGEGEYRIKPEVVKKTVDARLRPDGTGVFVVDLPFIGASPNLKLSFEEGKLIAAEVLK